MVNGSNGANGSKRVCLLTGSGSSLGTVFCKLFASQYQIAAVYQTRPPMVPSQRQTALDPLEPSADLAENANPVFAIQADLSQEPELSRIVDLVLARFGRIDLLVNAAGHREWSSMIESKRLLDSVERQFQVNTIVPLRLAVAIAWKFWRDRGEENRQWKRNVVNISSTAGLYVYPGLGQSVYSASKAALNFLTCHMADEFQAFGIRVNAAAPNSFPTLIPTEGVARAIARLDEGEMTGKILVLDTDGETLV